MLVMRPRASSVREAHACRAMTLQLVFLILLVYHAPIAHHTQLVLAFASRLAQGGNITHLPPFSLRYNNIIMLFPSQNLYADVTALCCCYSLSLQSLSPSADTFYESSPTHSLICTLPNISGVSQSRYRLILAVTAILKLYLKFL